MSNVYEELGRAKKVGKLVNKLQEHGYTVALVERMDHADWCVVSAEAGVIPPSDESKAVVLDELRRCEQLFRPATDTQFGQIGKPQPVVALVDGMPEPWEESTRLEETVTRMKREILADIASGVIPEAVASFSELHDHVDANGYGGAFESDAADNTPFWNEAQGAVDEWLRTRRP